MAFATSPVRGAHSPSYGGTETFTAIQQQNCPPRLVLRAIDGVRDEDWAGFSLTNTREHRESHYDSTAEKTSEGCFRIPTRSSGQTRTNANPTTRSSDTAPPPGSP